MNFAWYVGFGWGTVALLIVLGLATWQHSDGWLHWLLYIAFVLVAAYAFTRFRLYKREPWRRIHHRSFELIRDFIKTGQDLSAEGKRDALVISRNLARALLGDQAGAAVSEVLLTENGRKEYYRQLVEDYTIVFTQNLPPEKQEQAKVSLLKDIAASDFGPDIVIAVTIEKKYGRLEAARYLLAMASGYIK